VAQRGEALAHAAEALRADPEVVLAALRQDPEAFIFAAPALRAERAFVHAAVRQRGEVLRLASKELQADPEVARAAIAQNPAARAFVSADLQQSISAVPGSGDTRGGASSEVAGDKMLEELRDRLRDVQATGDLKGYDVALGDVLLKGAGRRPTISSIVEELFGVAAALAKTAEPGRLAEACLYSLFLFSVSTSQDEVRVRRGSQRGVGCALVLGFGGGHVDELEGQASFYQSLGFDVISLTPCLGPAALAQRQRDRVVQELREALVEGAGLVVHACSNVGMGCWINIMSAWSACAEEPWRSLPDLSGCLKALVFDCAPFAPVVEDQGKAAEPGGAAGLGSGADQGHEMLVAVMLGCMAGLCRRHAPGIRPFVLAQDKGFAKVLRAAAVSGSTLLAPQWPEFGDYAKWEQLDCALRFPLPRLFLYSARDQLFPPELIEAYVAHTARYNSHAPIFTERCERSPHCKLWDAERERCANAVTKMLRAVGVLTP